MIDLKKIPKGKGYSLMTKDGVLENFSMAEKDTAIRLGFYEECVVQVVIIKQTDWNKIEKFIKEKSK